MDFNILNFPWEQIGWGLRQLSLSGTVGNVVAIMLFIFIGAMPCGVFLLLMKKRKAVAVDGILVGLSVVLFYVLYYMINPGLLPATMIGSKMLLGSAFYSVFVGYLVLRILSANRYTDEMVLKKALRMVLYVVMFLFAWSVLVEFFVNLPTAIKLVQEGNTAVGMEWDAFLNTSDLTITYVFLMLQSVGTALPNGLCAITVFLCIRVLEELVQDAYSKRAQMLIKRVITFCKKSLVIVVLFGMGLNLAQIVFAHLLYQVNVEVNIPIFSLLFFLVIHLIARYIEENQKWKMENELFI